MDGVGRLRIVCLADQRTAAAAFAARGRLERVARSDLGPALDRQVGGRSIRLDRLTVRLELDPRDYDDTTLAQLWASRIHEALAGAEGPSLSPGMDSDGDAAVEAAMPKPSVEPTGSGADAIVVIARQAMRGDDAASLVLARAVVDDATGVARQLRSGLTPVEREALLRVLDASIAGRRLRPRRWSASAGARRASKRPPKTSAGSEPVGRESGPIRPWAARLLMASRRALSGALPSASHRAPSVRSTAGRVAARSKPAPAPDPGLISKAGGLVLLWPWLTTYLEAAVDRLPRLDGGQARRLALAALVPELAGGVDDAVVRLLAGDGLADEASVIVVTDAELRRAGDGAEPVLDAFAGSIPGFAGSSPAFVRREFLVRRGVVDPGRDPVAVRLEPMALDLVIGRLPYPIGAFGLPWTRPIAVHVEGR